MPLSEGQRKELVAESGHQTLEALLGSHVSTIEVARSFASLAGKGHVRLYSTHANEQAALAGFPLAGALPTSNNPFVGVYMINSSARKLDYYLQENIAYQGLSCVSGGVRSKVTLTLDNAAPANLPTFTAEGNVPLSAPLPSGENRELVSIVLDRGSQITGATLDGKPATWVLRSFEVGNRPVYLVQVDLPRAQSQSLVFSVTEPHAPGKPLVVTQPLPVQPKVTTSGASC